MLLPSDSTLSSPGGASAPRITRNDSDLASGTSAPHPHAPRILSAGDPGRYALIILTSINLLNYIDRYLGSATKQYYQADLHLTDTETSIPLTAFVFVYMLCSPVFSWLADLGYSRAKIIAGGVLIWSIATAAGALAVDFWTLLISRSLVGVGEAAYATIAPALLSDYYPASKRNSVLSFFYLAIPVGAAMGYAIGGEVGKYWGWRYAFLLSGAPGLAVAALCLLIDEPPLGALDHEHKGTTATGATGSTDSVEIDSPSRSRGDSSASESDQPAYPLSHPSMVDSDTDGDMADMEGRLAPVEGGAVGISYQPPAHHHHADGGSSSLNDTSTILVRSRAPTSADGQQPRRAVRPGHLVAPPWKESIVLLMHNPTYLYATGGMIFVIFASGALADWMPSWMTRVHGIDKDIAATSIGAVTCAAGIVGTAWGSWVGEYAKGRIAQPYLGVAGLNMIVTTACAWAVMLVGSNLYLIGALVFVAQVSMWAYTGPITALTINCVAPNMRVRAFAFQILLTHALGDAISPTIVGAISQATNSIRTAMLLVPVAFSLGCLTWLVGWRRLAGQAEFSGHVQAKSPTHSGAPASGAGGPAGEDSLRDPLMAGANPDQDATSIRMKHLQRQEVM